MWFTIYSNNCSPQAKASNKITNKTTVNERINTRVVIRVAVANKEIHKAGKAKNGQIEVYATNFKAGQIVFAVLVTLVV